MEMLDRNGCININVMVNLHPASRHVGGQIERKTFFITIPSTSGFQATRGKPERATKSGVTRHSHIHILHVEYGPSAASSKQFTIIFSIANNH
jgi:hypothetical protein